MTRFDITRILAPTAIKPRTSGPRDGSTSIHTQHVAIAPAIPAKSQPTPLLETTQMRTSNMPIVLAAITQKSPICRAELLEVTGLDRKKLGKALWDLKKNGTITGTRDEFALAGTVRAKAEAVTTKASKPAKNPCGPGAPTFGSRIAIAKVESAFGTDNQTSFVARLLEKGVYEEPEQTKPFSTTRAIATADGGCIVLDGALLIAELTKEQREAVATAA